MNNMRYVGTLQEYSTPFACLYEDISKHCLLLLVRISTLQEHKKIYAVIPVAVNGVKNYMSGKIGLNKLMEKKYPSYVEFEGNEIRDIDHAIVRNNQDKLLKDDTFDPEFCNDPISIKCFLNNYDK